MSSNPLRGQDRRPGAAECIDHDVASTRTVLHGVCDERDGFDGRMGL